MTRRFRFPWLTGLIIALIVLGAWDVSRRFVVDAKMDHFLPQSEARNLYAVSRQVMDSTLTRQMIITVTSPAPPKKESALVSIEADLLRLAEVAKHLDHRLTAVPGIASVISGPPEGIEDTLYELYFRRKFSFYSTSPESDAPKYFSPEAIERRIQSLKDGLSGPDAAALRALAPRDPLLLFWEYLHGLKGGRFEFDVVGGQFLSQDLRTEGAAASAILFVELQDSALDANSQKPTLKGVAHAIADTSAEFPEGYTVESTGMNRFAVAAETTMKADVQRVVGLSSLGLLLLFLGLFRAPKRLAFVLLPILAGLVFSAWVSLQVYGRIHALTLAFGASLIGVALDYPVHALCHFELDPKRRPSKYTLLKLRPTLAFAAGTTIAGLIGLGWTDFPGIREIALFTSSGIVAALLSTLMLGELLSSSPEAPPSMRRLASSLEKLLDWLRAHRALPLVFLFLALLLSVVGLTRTTFAPGLESLAPSDPALIAEDTRVRQRLGGADEAKFVVAQGQNLESALQTSEKSEVLLQRLLKEGKLAGYTSVSRFLRSRDLQNRSLAAVPDSKILAGRIRQKLAESGFVPDAFPDIESEIALRPKALVLSDLEGTPLEKLLSPFIFRSGAHFNVVTSLRGVSREAELAAQLEGIPGAQYFSQKRLLNQAYSDLRGRTIHLLLVGLLLVSAAAFLRYRSARRALSAIFPALLAACSTLGWLALVGQEVHLLHILGLLLACSMGVDYGVYLVDADDDAQGAALLSICIGCLSTILSFGVLSLSTAPALHALGVTIASGVLLSLFLAPITLLFIQAPKSSRAVDPS